MMRRTLIRMVPIVPYQSDFTIRRFLGGVIFCALTKYAGPPTEAGVANSISVLKPLAQRAPSLGIKLEIENGGNRFETNLLNTVEDGCRFIDRIGEDSLVVHEDTYHMNIEEDDMANAIRRITNRLPTCMLDRALRTPWLWKSRLPFGL
uniref:Xylose isomerase-like TIM barrel domain-containing protein n=1 Tax=Rhodosorus marinus TaxID=101924 RepID=A0A7S3E6S4_9RHOD|mmetsp:Transcript_13534/g.54261  ORF Transcript_13534/g.54261 Transcript_13534/m.54261 type:complete len:149 (+) Transcript_13534:221-667(+)